MDDLTASPEVEYSPSRGAVAAPDQPLAVEARGIWLSYRRSFPVLRDVDFSARRGQITMVLGASGSGKTTLLKLIKGLVRAERGAISTLGVTRSASSSPSGRLSPEIAYIPQNLGLVRNLTALENALIGTLGRLGGLSAMLGTFPADLVEDASARLTRLGLGDKLHQKVYNLSGGERQRVALVRSRMQRPQLMLADEFVSQLDPVTTAQIMATVKDRTRVEGATYIQTTHEMDLVSSYADHVVVLRAGEKVLDCPASEVSMLELTKVMKG